MFSDLAVHYLPILIFLWVAFGVAVVAVGLSFLLAKHKPDSEKTSAYECGFPAFGDARAKIDVRYYLVAILFIVFDLEIAFLIPWAIVLSDVGIEGFLSMMLFLAVLAIGFIY
jgi:NADH-quinone oxidoreductase subunit A